MVFPSHGSTIFPRSDGRCRLEADDADTQVGTPLTASGTQWEVEVSVDALKGVRTRNILLSRAAVLPTTYFEPLKQRICGRQL